MWELFTCYEDSHPCALLFKLGLLYTDSIPLVAVTAELTYQSKSDKLLESTNAKKVLLQNRMDRSLQKLNSKFSDQVLKITRNVVHLFS